MASSSRRIANVNGATVGPLKSVPIVDTSKGLVSAAPKSLPSQYRTAVADILAAIKQISLDQNEYELQLDAKMSDILLGRIASLLDEVKDTFVNEELEDLKTEILDAISGTSIASVLKNAIVSQITGLFDDDAKKSDIDDLKAWMQQNFQAPATLVESKEGTLEQEGTAVSSTSTEGEEEKEAEDAKKGDYTDSTPAKNFFIVQTFIQKQFDLLGKNLMGIPGWAGLLLTAASAMSKGFSGIMNKVSSIGKSLAKKSLAIVGKIGGMAKKVGKISAMPFTAVVAGIGAIGKSIKSVAGGVGKLGSKVGSVIASPFKNIGGFFSSFGKKKEDKKEQKKQALKDKMMSTMSRLMEKMWTFIEPILDKLKIFMVTAAVTIILPIALIMAKVLVIVAAIVLLAVGLYLAYKWVKAKVSAFIQYLMSGQLWEDIKAKIVAAWEWIKDFGAWIWKKLVEFGKWILDLIVKALKAVFVDFPVWIWKKLVEFGKWLYDNYIDKYIVSPFKTYVWEPLKALWENKVWPMIEPFVQSLTKLKDTIVQAFSAWDPNISIWDNLKNIGGILIESITQWWNESPFKVFYESYIEPCVRSAMDLIQRLKNISGVVKDAILDWWNGDSSLGETLSNIGGIVWDTVKEWWEGSVFKTYWEKLRDYLMDVTKPLREWYEKSALKPFVDQVKDIVLGLKDKLSNAIWELPMIGAIRPFGFLVGKPFKLGKEEKEEYEKVTKLQDKIADIGKDNVEVDEDIAKLEAKLKSGDYGWFKTKADIEKELQEKKNERANNDAEIDKANAQLKFNQEQMSKSLAAQQVQQAMQPINEMEKSQSLSQNGMQASSNEIASIVQKKEEDGQQFNAEQAQKIGLMADILSKYMPEMMDKLDKPQQVPMFVPYQIDNSSNSATMQEL